ncbi:MAG: 16S rRNA (cytosine(1402)-N(4))-methyltransferase [Chloroflexi bacterium RBG_16_54_18]|nr:MAG: 16S rRNA (cytosine(1402)-N(4))-methyltransferase [Chloroflexi bacterium RBG_16_54_18]
MNDPGERIEFPHYPVLYNEIIHALTPKRGGHYVDGTVGAGGHAWGILQASSPDGLLLGLDLDPQAVDLARRRLETFGTRAVIVQASYTSLEEQISSMGWRSVDGIVLDLGLSTMQLEASDRGFSFDKDARLDMRFDPSNPIRAEDILNEYSEQELAEVLFRNGEETLSYPISRAIILARPVTTTRQLAEIVSRVVWERRRGRSKDSRKPSLHPATRTFQALRIAVNNELENLETTLPSATHVLKPGGRIAIISFHSLEDRIVKQYFRRESSDCICPPRQPVCTCGHIASMLEITRHPLVPGQEELKQNPRSRSAKLRVAQKVG